MNKILIEDRTVPDDKVIRYVMEEIVHTAQELGNKLGLSAEEITLAAMIGSMHLVDLLKLLEITDEAGLTEINRKANEWMERDRAEAEKIRPVIDKLKSAYKAGIDAIKKKGE